MKPAEQEPSKPADGGAAAYDGPMGIGIFLISVAVLALQVLQTRILSVQMWHHHSYMVVTMTLLGFGAAGSLVTVWPSLARSRTGVKLAWCGTLFAVSTLAGYLLLSATADKAADLTDEGSYVTLSLFYSYLLVPYFFGGLVVTIVLTVARTAHRLYFVNLVGSAVGAWVFIAVITPMGAERLLVTVAALGPLAGMFFLRRGAGGEPVRGFTRPICAVALGGCLALIPSATELFNVKVASSKAESIALATIPGAKKLDEVWTPLCRLDFVELPGPEGEKGVINIYQDGDAITVMMSDDAWAYEDPLALNSISYLPHRVRGNAPEALAIGIGGGIDLRYALANGAKSVLGIEINATTVEKVGNEYAEFNGDVYHKPGVEVVVGEGRSALRRLEEKFDVIQLSGTDTYTAGTSGAYVLSESYLYTREAVSGYLDRLKPGGTLGFIRFGYDPPRETLRLFAICLTELRERGIENPSRHAAVVVQEVFHEEVDEVVRFAGISISVDPLEQQVIDVFQQHDGKRQHRLLYVPGIEKNNEFTQLASAIDAGVEDAFYDGYPYDVRPVGDDSPFFFNFFGWDDVIGTEVTTKKWGDLTGGPIGLKILSTLLIQTTLLTALLIVLPLVLLKRGVGRRSLREPIAGRTLAYFLALGAGFMFLEISTIQRLVLFLGHPTYSLTVTLFCFLFFAGLGSLVSGRFKASPARALRIIVLLIALLIGLMALYLEQVLHAALALPLFARIGVAAALLAPLNFLMGMPFPIGLDRLKRIEPRLVPWALGANGSASVVASILCIILAMETGFRAVSLISLAIYVIGMLLYTTGRLSPAADRT